MPDIAMCLNEACPRKVDCYRYTAATDEYQVWAMFDPSINCCFWSNGKLADDNKDMYPIKKGTE